MNKKFIPFALASMVMAVLAGCAKKDDSSSSISPTSEASNTSETSATSGATSASPTSQTSQTTSASSHTTSATSQTTSASSQTTSQTSHSTSSTSHPTSSTSITPTSSSSTPIPPVPAEPVYAYVLNGGEPGLLIEGEDPDGNPQLEAHSIKMNANDHLSFFNVEPDPDELLTPIRIDGDTHGFSVESGVLTADHSGEYSFFLKILGYEDNVVYISEAVDYTVTESEWAAALGPDTNFGIAENFALKVTNTVDNVTEEFNVFVDGNKMKLLVDGEEMYYSIEGEKVYLYNKEGLNWHKDVYAGDPKAVISEFTRMILDYAEFAFDQSDHTYKRTRYTLGDNTYDNIKVNFESKKLTYWDFDLSNTDIKNSKVTSQVIYGGQEITLPEITETVVKLMGSFDEWTGGIVMNLKENSSTEYVASEFTSTIGMAVKVKLNGEYISAYKTNCDSALDRNLVELDENQNIVFLVAGTFNIYFETQEGDQYGVYISSLHINSPFDIRTTFNGASTLDEKTSSSFNRVDSPDKAFVEYKVENLGSHEGYNYSVLKDNATISVTLEEGGESANFTPNGDAFTYSGSAQELNFYIKAYRDGTVKIYVDVAKVKPIYAYILNTDSPVTLTEGQDMDGNLQYEAIQIPMNENDTISFSNIAPATPEPLTGVAIGGDAHGFTADKGVLTATVAGTYNFYLKPEMNNDKVYIAEYVDTAVRLMGSFDEWNEGAIMELNEPSTTEYVVRDWKVFEGDEYRIKDAGTWNDIYKTTGGNDNAFAQNLCYVDTSTNNVVFRVSGVFTIYYEKDATNNPGVYISVTSVSSAYQGFIDYEAGGIHQSGWFEFNKVDLSDDGFIEYKILDVKAANGFVYSFKKNFEYIENVTLQTDAGVGSDFEKSGNGFVYGGTATSLDFYLKESLKDKSVVVYVEPHLEYIYDIKVNIDKNQTSWVLNDVDIFVAAFDKDNKVTWLPVSFTNLADNFTVTLPEGTVKFLAVRVVVGTVIPDWSITSGDEVGRIYNQTADINLQKGVSEYEVSFVDYPKK